MARITVTTETSAILFNGNDKNKVHKKISVNGEWTDATVTIETFKDAKVISKVEVKNCNVKNWIKNWKDNNL